MKRHLIFFSIIGIMAVSFTACKNSSKSSNSSKEVLTSEEAQKQIIGTWNLESNSSSCIIDGNFSKKTTLVIDENYINYASKEYSGSSCKDSNLKKDYIQKWDYEIERVARNNDAKFVVLERITKVEFTAKKGNFTAKEISTGEERGLAILLKNSDSIAIEDGDAKSISTINANNIKFSKTIYYKRVK